MGEPQPTVFVVDDDERMRRYCEVVVQHAGLATQQFTSASEFLSRYDHATPGCLLLDITMPGMNGLELQCELNQRGATIPVIFVTGVAAVPVAVAAMRRGAFDYLQKPLNKDDLLDRVRRALDFDASTRASLLERRQAEERFDSLTERERQTLFMIMGGLSNKQAAVRLHLSSRTVEIHRASLMRKTQALNTAHLVRMAIELDILPVGAARTD